MAVPLLQAASGCSWVTVLLTGLLCVGILWGMEKLFQGRRKPVWLVLLQVVWATVVLSEIMHWSCDCWQGGREILAIPLVLIALALWLTEKGKEAEKRAASLLRYFLIGLLSFVLLSAGKEIKIGNLRPAWQLKDGSLITVLLLPALQPVTQRNTGKGKTLFFALLFSVVTTGVLSLQTALQTNSPFYEMSRSLSFLGTVKRFESLTASAMTLGYFILFCFLLGTADLGRESWQKGKWWMAAAASCIYLFGRRLDSVWMAVICVLLWVLLPAVCCSLPCCFDKETDKDRGT